jgi:hypothetical protein
MAAVVVADEDDADLRSTVAHCRKVLTVPAGKHLHWQEHVKKFDRRQFVAEQLGSLGSRVTLNYVLIEKASIPTSSGIHADGALFYNYVAGLTMERILLSAKTWPGGHRPVKVHFGHVRGFDHQATLAYFDIKKERAPGWMPWHLISGRVNFLSMTSLDGLQAADQYAGMLHVALLRNAYGGYEYHHLLRVRDQIRRHCGACVNYGFKILCLPGTTEVFPWWSQVLV